MDAITKQKPRRAVFYKTRPIRRSKSQVTSICDVMLAIAQELQPMTVRQMFYQLVTRGVIDKSEPEYKNTVCRLLGDLRRRGAMPFRWIADNSRWQRKPDTYSSLADMLEQQQNFYRRAIWDSQQDYVEIWLEKEALSGVLYKVTSEWDVPLMVTRGYSSLSFLHEAAETFAGIGKPIYLYYFGDNDPSGEDIPRVVERTIREFAPNIDLHFKRLAVLPEQVVAMNLQTRPTKESDSRAKNFCGESVEVDAIHPKALRKICAEAIVAHIDVDVLKSTAAVESAERETLAALIGGME